MAKAELPPPQQSTGPQEACGITARLVQDGSSVAPLLAADHHYLRHRGVDSTGIAVFNHEAQEIHAYKGSGKSLDVFSGELINRRFFTQFNFAAQGMNSDIGIGHNRYGTSGNEEKDSIDGAQPMVMEWEGRKLALAFNGNIPEQERVKLRDRIPDTMPDLPDFDTNDILKAIISAPGDEWEDRIKNGMEGIKGAYSLTMLTDTNEIWGLRGPSGTWPLWVGEESGSIIFSSESVVDTSEHIDWSPVSAGELVRASRSSGLERKQLFTPEKPPTRCSLHDVYGARKESLMTNDTTYQTFRELIGRQLAREHPIEGDVYVGVPNVGSQLVVGYAEELGVSVTDAFETLGDNRSFILANVASSEKVINEKFYIKYPENILGKSVVLVDDSVIKGSTMGGNPDEDKKGIIQHLRDAGAQEVHLVVGLSKFVDSCDQGYYIVKDRLVALEGEGVAEYRELDEEEIAKKIGADSVSFISIDGINSVYEEVFAGEEHACFACMGGPHPLHDLPEGSIPLREVFADPFIDIRRRVGRIVTVGD